MTTRLAALSRALDAGSGRFFDPSTIEARKVVERAGSRLELSMRHTVVALAGSTGGGKSSLFNVICEMDIARVGVRRPTTSQPLACVWGSEGAQSLLDWLEVPAENRVSRESVLEPGAKDVLDGLVLLDLPDHDSTEAAHRHTVDRMVGLVDLFVWVMDPQKYADAAVHERYLRRLSAHSDVTVVVLNQLDRLAPEDVEACIADLRRLLDDDGLAESPIMPLSAASGVGVGSLVELLRATVLQRRAGVDRIEADARACARSMLDAIGDGRPGELSDDDRERLVDQLAAAARIDELAAMAANAHLRRPRRRPVPEPAPLYRDTAQGAVNGLGDVVTGSLAGGWGGSIRSVAEDAAAQVADALEQELRAIDLDGGRGGRWWRLSGAVEWCALVAGVAGGVWALVLEGQDRLELAWLRDLDLFEPDLAGTSAPLILLVAGGAGALLAEAVRSVVARRARRRREAELREHLREVVTGVADKVVVEPLRAELDRFDTFRRALEHASS